MLGIAMKIILKGEYFYMFRLWCAA